MKFVLHLAAAGQGQKVACWVSSRWPQAASTPPGSLGFNFKHRVHPHKHPHSAAVALFDAVLFFTILVIPEMSLAGPWLGLLLNPCDGSCTSLVGDKNERTLLVNLTKKPPTSKYSENWSISDLFFPLSHQRSFYVSNYNFPRFLHRKFPSSLDFKMLLQFKLKNGNILFSKHWNKIIEV